MFSIWAAIESNHTKIVPDSTIRRQKDVVRLFSEENGTFRRAIQSKYIPGALRKGIFVEYSPEIIVHRFEEEFVVGTIEHILKIA